MPNVNASISQAVSRSLDDAARHHDRSREDLVRLAVEYYLHHLEQMTRLADDGGSNGAVDWALAKETLQHARCPFDECPMFGDCPAGLCPL